NHSKLPLSGTLRIVSLQDCPRFMTLSYVWGEYSTPRDAIHCNEGTVITITTNCRDALIALRKRYGKLTIWVDAICINQQDIQERSKQISLMEEIYSWSERVIVWLGPGDKSSRKAM
ncbi:heterokaryon incompatibility, partial [Cadophora sp. DSE1049]